MYKKHINDFKKKVSKSYELITTSYHEAGHAIYALLKFMMVDSISLDLNAKSLQVEGLTQYYSYLEETEDSEINNFYAVAEICVMYAGLTTEKLFYKKISGSDKFPSFLKDGSSSDTQTAAKIFKKYNFATPGQDRFIFKKKITKQIAILLDFYWEDIEILSHFLFQKKKITYEQIKKLLVTKSKNKNFWKHQLKKIETLYHEDMDLDDDTIRIMLNL